jgi:hypothetical protein
MVMNGGTEALDETTMGSRDSRKVCKLLLVLVIGHTAGPNCATVGCSHLNRVDCIKHSGLHQNKELCSSDLGDELQARNGGKLECHRGFKVKLFLGMRHAMIAPQPKLMALLKWLTVDHW